LAKKTLKITGTFGAGNESIKTVKFNCETCFGEFDIEIPFETTQATPTQTAPLQAQVQDMGEVSDQSVKKRKMNLSAKP
jgi:hypothetical protein